MVFGERKKIKGAGRIKNEKILVCPPCSDRQSPFKFSINPNKYMNQATVNKKQE